jgi:hypothetical protein
MQSFEQATNRELLSQRAGRPVGDPHPQTEAGQSSRTLKIEADGDFWKGLIKPKIRLMGRWLERAGFSPGGQVQVTCVAPGVIELRSPNALTFNDAKMSADGFKNIIPATPLPMTLANQPPVLTHSPFPRTAAPETDAT